MKKKVYICAPLGGNVKENLENAVLYTKYALKQGVAPITTHFYALCLDDDNPQAIPMSMGMITGIRMSTTRRRRRWRCWRTW